MRDNWIIRGGRIVAHALAQEPDDVRAEVRDAFDRLCENPENPHDVMRRRPRGRAAELLDDGRPEEKWIALMPHGWRLSYLVVRGAPPLSSTPMLIVRAFVKDASALPPASPPAVV